jgi:hypothetical protein
MQVAIRCHPYAPVASDELEDWLAREVDRIRAAAPDATVRLMRLSQPLSAGRVAVGWLIELEGLRGEVALTDLQLDTILRDMRLLGLQPTLLAPRAREQERHGFGMRGDADKRVGGAPDRRVGVEIIGV